MKFKGFTLAEVLVTIGIIGVIATMTMPALIQKYKTIEYTSRVKKAYNTISVAMNEYLRVKGADKLSNTKFIIDPYTELHSVLRVIDGNSYGGYYNMTRHDRQVMTLDDNSYNWSDSDGFGPYMFLLPDGSIVSMSTPVGNSGEKDIVARIVIDTNGAKLPNQLGRDIFMYKLQNDGYVAPLDAGDSVGSNGRAGSDCYVGGTGTSCSSKVMDDGWEMNY